MSVETFNKFRLLFCQICIDCHQEELSIFLGDLFNTVGDLAVSDFDLINTRPVANVKILIYRL